MSFYGMRLGCLEVAIEKHSASVTGGLRMSRPGAGEIMLEAGKFTIMGTLFKPQRLNLTVPFLGGLTAAIIAFSLAPTETTAGLDEGAVASYTQIASP